jgi:phytol kinase
MDIWGIDTNMVGLIASYVFIFIIIGLATLLQQLGLNDEGSRKFIHIGVAHWYIIAMVFFNLWYIAIIPPITFIILNYISYRKNVFKAMERSGHGDLGTVYFPISLLIITAISFLNTLGFEDPKGMTYFGLIPILIMGYGDGFAAVIGKTFGKRVIKEGKTLEGTLTMFVASFIVTLLSLYLLTSLPSLIWMSLIIAIAATLLELYSKKGLDNLYVPLGTFVIYFMLYLMWV